MKRIKMNNNNKEKRKKENKNNIDIIQLLNEANLLWKESQKADIDEASDHPINSDELSCENFEIEQRSKEIERWCKS